MTSGLPRPNDTCTVPFGVIDRLDVDERRQLVGRLRSARRAASSCRSASALAMRSFSDASRLASALISSTEARTRRSASSCACWKRPSVARNLAGQRLALAPARRRARCSTSAPARARRRRRRTASAARSSVASGEPRLDFDDAERVGQRRLAVLRRVLLEQAAIEEAIAQAAHAEHFDAVAGVQALAGRRHRAEVDDAARVAGRVDVGDVLAG